MPKRDVLEYRSPPVHPCMSVLSTSWWLAKTRFWATLEVYCDTSTCLLDLHHCFFLEFNFTCAHLTTRLEGFWILYFWYENGGFGWSRGLNSKKIFDHFTSHYWHTPIPVWFHAFSSLSQCLELMWACHAPAFNRWLYWVSKNSEPWRTWNWIMTFERFKK